MEKYNQQLYGDLGQGSNQADGEKKEQQNSQIIVDQQQHEFNLDRQEYQQVFRHFDKSDTGEISIQQVYELINKFDSNEGGLNLNQEVNGSKTGSRQYGHGSKATQNNSLYGVSSHMKKNTVGDSISSGKNNSKGLQMNGASNHGYHPSAEINGSTKFSPSRRHTQQNNGGFIPTQNGAGIGSNILQLRPTQPLNNKTQNNDIISNNKSPRRQSHLYHGKDPKNSGNVSIKLNVIGGNNNNSQIGSSKSDGNDEDGNAKNDDNSPGIKTSNQGNSKIKQQINGGSANNLLTQTQLTSSSTPSVMEFPNGKETLKFEEFINVIRDSCTDNQIAENYLILAFSMFDRQKKGYISPEDLKDVFDILGESITDEEVNTMIKIAGIKSNDKINFKEFVDFFYKID